MRRISSTWCATRSSANSMRHDLNDQSYRIYTTLDPDLQKAAAQAVESGHQAGRRPGQEAAHQEGEGRQEIRDARSQPGPQAQVALVALDPHTGAVLALVGGRDYGWSQLNHAVAKRPTGSIFKPFVYAAAMNTALDGSTDRDHSGVDRDGCAFQFCLRRPDLRAAQL